jgi:Hypothetical glycosyl hydrolase 6
VTVSRASSSAPVVKTPSRQVHLDFHTSPWIDDVAVDFDPHEFVSTLQEARVQSVTLFSKCHHGMSYYPTKVGTQHPALKGRDLMGEMIEALHSAGIRCPIYTTVAWEEDVAMRFPQWRQMRRDGTYARIDNSTDGKTWQPGGWWFCNYLDPDYQNYIEAHVRELLANYDVDGLFFDILFMDGRSCWSQPSLKIRQEHGLLGEDRRTQARFDQLSQRLFCERFTPMIRGIKPDALIFYNSPNPISIDANAGVRVRAPFQTHYEVESLPSGAWGYHHFPRVARAVAHWGKPWIGMTGRFQKQWGDFGGIKPQAALEYECFRTQALGGANSVGDQLPPRGRLEPAAYRLIGKVFAACEQADAFYEGSTAAPQIGILAPGHESVDSHHSDMAGEAAVMLCDALHYDSAIVQDTSDLSGFRLLICPDTVVLTETLLRRLKTFLDRGGRLLASYRSLLSGVDPDEISAYFPVVVEGETSNYPTFWRGRAEFSPSLADSDRVFYLPGLEVSVRPGSSMKPLIDRVHSYFKRSDLKFCSHFHTPPVRDVSGFAAALGSEQVVYFADPVFREYRQTANTAVAEALSQTIRRLAGPPMAGEGLPNTVQVFPRRRGNDLLLTLLHYIPVRKAVDVDVVDQSMSFAGLYLRLSGDAERVIDDATGKPLVLQDEGFALPAREGRLLLSVPKFF